jgi:hypothetical protein
MSGLRVALVALLVLSTALFATGAIAECSQTSGPAESAGQHARESSEPSGKSETTESAGPSESGESAGTREREGSPADHVERETVLGVAIESAPLIVLAIVAGLALAVLVASPTGRRPVVLLTIAVIMVAWAALDVPEVVHQLNESRTGLAGLAAVVALLHLAAAVVAMRLAAREHSHVASPGRPGTIPA